MRLVFTNILFILLISVDLLASEYQSSKTGIMFTWINADRIGVYSTTGSRNRYSVSNILNDSHFSCFVADYELIDNSNYYAYSPYNKSYYPTHKITNLPIVFTSQKQSANSNTSHLSNYDYQMAKFTTGVGTASIEFTHIGSILHFSWTLPEAATLTSLTMSSDEALFATDATMNLPQQTVTAGNKAKTMSLALDNINIVADGTLDAYLAILPVDLSGKAITFTLTTADGKTIEQTLTGTTLQAGKVYPITIGGNKVEENASGAKSFPLQPETTGVASITVYSPDFQIDTDHVFTQSELGDVNGDGRVNICDVTALIKHCMAGTTASLDKQICDINGDGVVTYEDANAIADKCILGK